MSSRRPDDCNTLAHHDAKESEPAPPGSVLIRLMEECLVQLEAGEAIDRERLIAANPELASQIDACLASLQFIHRAAQPTDTAPTRLGDFRIIREIGRGGMGVVYEAEQISLKRRVALKVLRFGTVADREAMQRFQREAETIASLHHTNIVPVFAIGVEEAVHYYAMQLIEGRSLRDIVQDQDHTSLPAKTIAQWGLQAAEALAHAHQRNVVHRDIKPSNLILGTDGAIWLTDFGLAKRLDDVTLSLSGVLLGTPRYMSPEQASAMRTPVDHRTDIYSLGATLYELATGQPLFPSESPHVIISQILSVEPKSPRQIAPCLPRDLETIILKCLCKNPAQRYQSARALADDLRAFDEGRSINARQPTVVERAGRWMKKHRGVLVSIFAAVAATIVLSLGSSLWWQQIVASRNATLLLKTTAGPLTAEVLTRSGSLAVPPFTIPSQQPVSVPAGEYRLRVSGRGHFSKTSLLTLHRGQPEVRDVDLEQETLYPPIPVPSAIGYEFIDFGDGPDLIVLPSSLGHEANDNRLRRISGTTGREIWSLDVSPTSVAVKSILPSVSPQSGWFGMMASTWKVGGAPVPRALRPLLDLDSDGVPDLVWLHDQAVSVFAVSGKSGQPLWFYRGSQDPLQQSRFTAAALEDVAQADGRMLPTLILTEVTYGVSADALPAARLLAINAIDASSLWSVNLPTIPSKLAVAPGQMSSSQEVPSGRSIDVAVIYSPQELRLIGLASGQAIGLPLRFNEAYDSKFVDQSTLRIVDVDNDGQSESLLVRHIPNRGPQSIQLVALSATGLNAEPTRPNWLVSLADGQTEKGAADYNRQYAIHCQDLNGDGVLEIVVMPDRGEFDCRVLEGTTGRELWRHRRSSDSPTRRHSTPLVGDDLNGDGWREVFVVSLESNFPQSHRDHVSTLLADCFSGVDGRSIWSSKNAMPGRMNLFAQTFGIPPEWSSRGPNTDAVLFVTVLVEPEFPRAEGYVVALAARTGQVLEMGSALARPQLFDLDHDGLDELAVATLSEGGVVPHLITDRPAQLQVFKGQNPVSWQRFGDWRPLMDLDGDGFCELWSPTDRSPTRLPIISGRDGSHIAEWTDRGEQTQDLIPLTNPAIDVDGDGLPEVLMVSDGWLDQSFEFNTPPNSHRPGLRLVSSKNQRTLWEAPAVPLPRWPGMKRVQLRVSQPQYRNLRGSVDGEIVAAYCWGAPPEQAPPTAGRFQYGLMVLNSHTGQLKWQVVLMEEEHQEMVNWIFHKEWLQALQFGDLDEDGVQDILVPLAATPWHFRDQRGMVVQARSGRDGHLLWPEFRSTSHRHTPHFENLLQVGLGNVDGHPGDEVVRLDFIAPPNDESMNLTGELILDVLDGRSGKSLFSRRWPAGWTAFHQPRLMVLRQPNRATIVVTKANFDPKIIEPLAEEDWTFLPPRMGAEELAVAVPELEIDTRRTVSRRDSSWKVDLNSDGIDELISWHAPSASGVKASLTASRGLSDSLWKLSLPRLENVSWQPWLKLLESGQGLLLGTGPSKFVISVDGQLRCRFSTTNAVGANVMWGARNSLSHWGSKTPLRIIVKEDGLTRSEIVSPIETEP